MGQKVHPVGFRLGVIRGWQGKWYADREYTALFHEDLRVREMIMGRLTDAGVSRVEIERSANQMTVTIHAAKPGIVIGKSGVKVEELRKNLEAMTGKRVRVTIQEIRQPELDAYLVARSVADQLERRVAFRRAMKQSADRGMRFGARGIRIQVSGRLGGAEMSRREWERRGRVPLHTLRADIDFGQAEAHTTFGLIGVKAWIYRGDVPTSMRQAPELPPVRTGRPVTVTDLSERREPEAEDAAVAVLDAPPATTEPAAVPVEPTAAAEPATPTPPADGESA